MGEEIQIQTVDEVKTIDYMKNTNDLVNTQIEQQNNNLSEVANTLDTISNTLDSIDFSNTDSVSLSEVTESINNIDTTIVEAQTQDILSIVNSQQEQIDTIQSDIQEIKQLLNQLLKQ